MAHDDLIGDLEGAGEHSSVMWLVTLCSEAAAALRERDERERVLRDGWDTLLEDIEMHGMHDFEPYVKSKARFAALADHSLAGTPNV